MKPRKAKQAFIGTVTDEVFLQTLMRHLVEWNNSLEFRPDGQPNILELFRNFCTSLRAGHYQRTAPMIRATCRELGVPCTRESIDKLFKKDGNNGTE